MASGGSGNSISTPRPLFLSPSVNGGTSICQSIILFKNLASTVIPTTFAISFPQKRLHSWAFLFIFVLVRGRWCFLDCKITFLNFRCRFQAGKVHCNFYFKKYSIVRFWWLKQFIFRTMNKNQNSKSFISMKWRWRKIPVWFLPFLQYSSIKNRFWI